MSEVDIRQHTGPRNYDIIIPVMNETTPEPKMKTTPSIPAQRAAAVLLRKAEREVARGDENNAARLRDRALRLLGL